MKKYVNPEIEILYFKEQDAIRTSGELKGTHASSPNATGLEDFVAEEGEW